MGEQWGKAAAILRQTIKCFPGEAAAHNNLAICCNALGLIPEAIEHSTIATQLDPQPAHYNTLGLILERDWQLEAAARAFCEALKIKDEPASWVNLGNVRMTQRRWAESEAAYNMAPQNHGVLCNLGYLAFLQNDLPRGWELYEHRLWHYPAMLALLNQYGPNRITKENLAQARGRIVVHLEQGIGDCLQFVRYVWPLIERTKATVTVVCPQPLLRLLHHQGWPFPVVAESPGQFDWWAPAMSLPHILGIPCLESAPYITAPPINHGYTTGLVTSGNPGHPNDYNRSLPPGLLASDSALDLRPGFCPLPINDWFDTAQIVAGLDRVVTVDTGVMHLAAAMGKPTTALISYRPDSRWGTESTTSPWYSSLELVRQTTGGDWLPCVNRVLPLLSLTQTKAPGFTRGNLISATCL